MKQSTWRALAFGALLGAIALPASAQVVIGGSNAPSVEVNWSVLDNLGRQPTLADMLKQDLPGAQAAAAAPSAKSKGVQYRPYKPGAKPYAKPAKAQPAPKAKKSQVVPASAKTERAATVAAPVEKVADVVKPVQVPRASAQPPVPPKAEVTPVAETPKVEAPKPSPAIVGPQVALPEVPKPVAATAPVQLAKAETAPAPAAEVKPEPKVEAKAEPVSLPPTALTPPPLPPQPAKVEAPQQIASLPPAPAAAPAAAPVKGSDTLSIPFAADSARVPDSVQSDLDRLVKRMQTDDNLGLQLLAYAEGDEANASKARRLSLSRALEVRKYLMEQGVRSTRIEVRALGNKVEGSGSADRVDAVLVSR